MSHVFKNALDKDLWKTITIRMPLEDWDTVKFLYKK